MALPVRPVQQVIAGRLETRAGFQQQNAQALLAQTPGGGRAAGTGAHDHGIEWRLQRHGGGYPIG